MNSILAETDAAARASCIKAGLFYMLFFNLQIGQKYSGISTIKFTAICNENIFLDYSGKNLDYLSVNNEPVTIDSSVRNLVDNKIWIPKDLIKIGQENIIHTKFSNDYYKDGSGQVTYTGSDGEQYLYSQSEPYWMNRVVPLIDQPNLKGKLFQNIAGPDNWTAVSTQHPFQTLSMENFAADFKDNVDSLDESEADISEKSEMKEFLSKVQNDYSTILSNGSNTITSFKLTPSLPTYQFFFAIGNWEIIPLDETKQLPNIPMRIFCRKDLAKFCKESASFIFESSKQAISYYQTYFGYFYPFVKQDIIFCPEFTSGAMENPGAITYSDVFMPHEELSQFGRSMLSMVIFHETAHMWFGDIVTMNWWNDLWLNESFADAVAYLGLANSEETLKVMNGNLFFQMRKGWGYEQDQFSTTHSVAGSVANTSVADSNFDGITYSKGAASLKNLISVLGQKIFAKSMNEYFKKYQWGNSTLEQLLEIIQGNLPKDDYKLNRYVDNFKQDYLVEIGMNEIQPVRVCVDKENTGSEALRIRQSNVMKNLTTLRHHYIKIAFFDEEARIVKVKDLLMDKEEYTSVDIDFEENYKAILLNYQDLDFVKVRLDHISRKFFRKNFGKLDQKDDQTKGVIMRAFYDEFLDAKMKAKDFALFMQEIINYDKSAAIINVAFLYLNGVLALNDRTVKFGVNPITSFLPKDLQYEILANVFSICYIRLSFDEPNKDIQRVLLDGLILYATTLKDVTMIKQWLTGENKFLVDKFPLSIEKKWKILIKVYTHEKIEKQEKDDLLKQLYFEDATDLKNKYKLIIKALDSNDLERNELMDDYFTVDSIYSYTETRNSLIGFNHSTVPESSLQLSYDRFYKEFPEVVDKKSLEFSKEIFFGMVSDSDDIANVIDKTKEMMSRIKDDHFYLKKLITNSIESMEQIKASRDL